MQGPVSRNAFDAYFAESAVLTGGPSFALLKAQCFVESGFDQSVVREKDLGIAQFQHATWILFTDKIRQKLKLDNAVVPNVFDPQHAIAGQSIYMQELFEKYSDWQLALAAYNAGPSVVDGWIIQYASNKWDDIAAGLACEQKSYALTNAYVRRILQLEQQFSQQATHSDQPPPLSRLSLDSHIARVVVAAEDASFFSHRGVRPLAIVRAAIALLTPGRAVQGGSTITEQVVKNRFYLHIQSRLLRRCMQCVKSLWYEQEFSKQQILHQYLEDIVYWGSNCVGIYSASQKYFATVDPNNLTLPQAVWLASLLPSPNRLVREWRDQPQKVFWRFRAIWTRLATTWPEYAHIPCPSEDEMLHIAKAAIRPRHLISCTLQKDVCTILQAIADDASLVISQHPDLYRRTFWTGPFQCFERSADPRVSEETTARTLIFFRNLERKMLPSATNDDCWPWIWAVACWSRRERRQSVANATDDALRVGDLVFSNHTYFDKRVYRESLLALLGPEKEMQLPMLMPTITECKTRALIPEDSRLPTNWQVQNVQRICRSVTKQDSVHWWHNVLERFLVAIFLCLPVTLLVLIPFVILIGISDQTWPVFCQKRIGRNGQQFSIYKLKTMRPVNNTRVPTTLGLILRKLHLDELLQVYNIVLGDMSLIGPRPLMGEELAWMHSLGWCSYDELIVRSQVRPGIFGQGQQVSKKWKNIHLKIQKDVEHTFLRQRGTSIWELFQDDIHCITSRFCQK